jgi:hypothetical protein
LNLKWTPLDTILFRAFFWEILEFASSFLREQVKENFGYRRKLVQKNQLDVPSSRPLVYQNDLLEGCRTSDSSLRIWVPFTKNGETGMMQGMKEI